MDPQVPNISTSPVEDPVKPMIPDTNSKIQADNHWISILAMAIFVLFSLGVVAFLYYQNQQLKSMLASFQPQTTPTPTASTSPTPNPEMPIVSSPSANLKVVSPLKVAGTVPTGWMFEGVFPIKLVDLNRKLIVQGQAKEKVAGNWQGGSPVDFTATLTFKTSSASGFLILQNDNPSGDPANSKTFEVPVKFLGQGDEVLGIQTNTCCSCPTKVSKSAISTNGWVLYEKGKDYSGLLPAMCKAPNIGACAPCPPLEE